MKTKNILTSGFAVLLAVIFTSCSTSVEIAKRHFNNGYYVHITSKKPVSTPEKEVITVKNEVQAVAVSNVKNEVVVSKAATPVVAIQEQNTSEVKAVSAIKKTVDAAKKKQLEILPEISEAKQAVSEFSNSNSSVSSLKSKGLFSFLRGDAPAIVLILLCIFIPPIAVGIVDDWGSKFWFDILLTLLFYFPGMIYAFFVCFG